MITFLLSLSFLDLWEWPYTGTKIQLPELLFLTLLAGVGFIKGFSFQRFIRLDYFLIILIGIFGLSALVNRGNYLEIIGLVYLFLIYLVFSQYLWKGDRLGWLKLLVQGLLFGAVLAAILGILGFILASVFRIDTPLSWSASQYYPYLGYIGRARAYTTNPNMLFSFLAMVFMLHFGISMKISSVSKGLLFLILLGMLLTFSKMILAFLIGVLWIWYKNDKSFSPWKFALFYGFSSLLFGVLIFGTHIFISPSKNTPWDALKEFAYTEDKPVITSHGYHFILTNYTVNKKAAVSAGIEHLPFGVGPGGFNSYVAEQKLIGRYPMFFTNYDPHSTYFGAFAENGVLGLVIVLFLFGVIYFDWKRVFKQESKDNWQEGLVLGIGGSLVFIAIEAVSTDVLNFRHYWVLLGILGVYLRKYAAKSSAQKSQME